MCNIETKVDSSVEVNLNFYFLISIIRLCVTVVCGQLKKFVAVGGISLETKKQAILNAGETSMNRSEINMTNM